MKIPEPSNSVARLIDLAISERAKNKESRNYIGASSIGEECDAALWFSIKHPIKITEPRVNRIFDMGNLIEDYVIELLRLAGLAVHTRDEEGNQFGFTDGKIAGHIDGVVTGLPESKKPHLFECKSMKSSNFAKIQKEGLKNNNQKDWAQVQVYMLKMELERCLFVVMNKDTQELYFERIKLDKMEANHFLNRAKEIDSYEKRPERKYKNKAFYKCKICSYRERCWVDEGARETSEESTYMGWDESTGLDSMEE